MQRRCRGDAEEMQRRCRGDAGGMQGRCKGGAYSHIWPTFLPLFHPPAHHPTLLRISPRRYHPSIYIHHSSGTSTPSRTLPLPHTRSPLILLRTAPAPIFAPLRPRCCACSSLSRPRIAQAGLYARSIKDEDRLARVRLRSHQARPPGPPGSGAHGPPAHLQP